MIKRLRQDRARLDWLLNWGTLILVGVGVAVALVLVAVFIGSPAAAWVPCP